MKKTTPQKEIFKISEFSGNLDNILLAVMSSKFQVSVMTGSVSLTQVCLLPLFQISAHKLDPYKKYKICNFYYVRREPTFFKILQSQLSTVIKKCFIYPCRAKSIHNFAPSRFSIVLECGGTITFMFWNFQLFKMMGRASSIIVFVRPLAF